MRVLFSTILFLIAPFSLFGVSVTVDSSKALHLALKELCSNGEDSTIVLEDGVYSTTVENIGTFIYDGIDGKNLTIKSKSGNRESVIISGENSHRVLHLKSNSATSIFEIDGVTIQKGFVDDNGSGIHTLNSLKIKNSKFLSNVSYQSGGAIFGVDIEVDESEFLQNRSGYTKSSRIEAGGGAIKGETIYIRDGYFFQNSANYSDGGAIHGGDIYLSRVRLIQNTTSSQGYGGAIFATKSSTIVNSLFLNNTSSLDSGALKSDSFGIINSTFLNNSAINSPKSIYGKGLILNSILKSGSLDTKITATSTLSNNYLDYPSLIDIENNQSQTIYMSNNIQTLSSDDFLNSDGVVTKSSERVVDRGLNPSENLFKSTMQSSLLSSDAQNFIDANMHLDLLKMHRVAKSSVDIGAYEFESIAYDLKPIVGNFDLNGTKIVGDIMNIGFEVTPAYGRDIVEISIDTGDGLFKPILEDSWIKSSSKIKAFHSHTYQSGGEFEIRVRAKDSIGDITIDGISLKVEEQCVVCDCDFTPYELNQTHIDVLNSGWHLLGAPKDIDITTSFPNATRIWVWEDDDWLVYDKNSSINQITTIKAKQGFWYIK